MRKVGELSEAIARLKRLQSVGGSELVHDGRFRKALQKLEVIEKGGTIARRDLVRAIAVIARVVCEEQLKNRKLDGTR